MQVAKVASRANQHNRENELMTCQHKSRVDSKMVGIRVAKVGVIHLGRVDKI